MATPKEKTVESKFGFVLIKAWREFHDSLTKDKEDGYFLENEAHYESICLGWCCAKGLTIDDAFDFYRERVNEGHHF
jgi:hypothetical protein